jgi:hypothetical protein
MMVRLDLTPTPTLPLAGGGRKLALCMPLAPLKGEGKGGVSSLVPTIGAFT